MQIVLPDNHTLSVVCFPSSREAASKYSKKESLLPVAHFRFKFCPSITLCVSGCSTFYGIYNSRLLEYITIQPLQNHEATYMYCIRPLAVLGLVLEVKQCNLTMLRF